MFILSSISSGLQSWSVNNTSSYENSKLKVFKNIKSVCGISNNLPKDLLETNVYTTLKSCLYSSLTILQWTNTI